MSVVFVVVPIVAGSWPIISAAIVAAGAAMGYHAVRQAEANYASGLISDIAPTAGVRLVMEDSQIVAENLMRGEAFTLQRDDLTAVFRMDGRGQCTVHVSGEGRSNQDLEAAGHELMDRVRQQYAYAKVMAEMEERGFEVIGQEVDADNAIRLRVRRWN
jgi:hypothetical protein